jgi:hypothetical protein
MATDPHIQESVEAARQRKIWDSLSEGAIVRGAMQSMYLVLEKDGDRLVVAPLDHGNRLRLTRGHAGLERCTFQFGELEIIECSPMPEAPAWDQNVSLEIITDISFLDGIL